MLSHLGVLQQLALGHPYRMSGGGQQQRVAGQAVDQAGVELGKRLVRVKVMKSGEPVVSNAVVKLPPGFPYWWRRCSCAGY